MNSSQKLSKYFRGKIFNKKMNLPKKSSDSQIFDVVPIDVGQTSIEDRTSERNGQTENNSKILQTAVTEFFSESNVHGFRYFTERKRHCSEKIWWIISFVLSVALCAYAIFNIWVQWQERPVIVSFDDKITSIAMIPFPAVTICSSEIWPDDYSPNKGRIHSAAVLNDILSNMHNTKDMNYSTDDLNQADVYQQLCYKSTKLFQENVFDSTWNESIHETIRDMVPTQFLFKTMFGSSLRLFSPIFTEEGLCYTFNSLNSREIFTDEINPKLLTVENNPKATHWNRDDGYEANVNESDLYPYRVFGCNSVDTLILSLGITVDDSYDHCPEYTQGFRLSLHAPDELPRLTENFMFISFGKKLFISVKPNMITTSTGLSEYPSGKRGCFFKSERQLRFFQSYSQSKCEIECLANYTKQECGCVTFSMPGDNATNICTMREYECYVNADIKFSKELIIKKCNCLPDCTSINYDVEDSQTQMRSVTSFYTEKRNNVKSNLSISFKQLHFIAMHRAETNTMSDFVASCGGLLGLFMGVSILSLVELIYYFTLRLFCTVRRNSVGKDA